MKRWSGVSPAEGCCLSGLVNHKSGIKRKLETGTVVSDITA